MFWSVTIGIHVGKGHLQALQLGFVDNQTHVFPSTGLCRHSVDCDQRRCLWDEKRKDLGRFLTAASHDTRKLHASSVCTTQAHVSAPLLHFPPWRCGYCVHLLDCRMLTPSVRLHFLGRFWPNKRAKRTKGTISRARPHSKRPSQHHLHLKVEGVQRGCKQTASRQQKPKIVTTEKYLLTRRPQGHCWAATTRLACETFCSGLDLRAPIVPTAVEVQQGFDEHTQTPFNTLQLT